MEFSDLQMFIKKNSKIVSLNIEYNTDEGDVYNYKINAEGIDYNLKFITDTEIINMIYDDKTINNDNDIQLELFEMLDYKNIEYIDNYLQLKLKQKSHIYIEDIYNDYYDDINKELICIRNLISSNETKKITKLKFIIYNNNCELYYNYDVINDFENIIRKIDEIINSL
jgi:hypothetical protein